MSRVLVLNGPNLNLLGRRHRSYVSEVADVVICGAGAHGCAPELMHLSHLLERKN
ncbi:hypothetical protein [Nonomuraea basaltis]|uniref:hypothetical protein n=1 Tax=Nonomuraea basaltis TaxID=2495887 RepID=UPI0014864489|nr:hypothetical protein [Nonomuraea basaltis]